MRSSNRPVVVIDGGDLTDQLFPREALEQLGRHADVVESGGNPLAVPEADRAAARILITSWVSPPLGGEIMAAYPNLLAVAHAGGSVKRIMTAQLMQSGVQVSTQVERNAEPVADYAVAMIVASLKGVFSMSALYRKERDELDRWPHLATLGISGRSVGLIGASRVGRAVARQLRRHDDLRILVYDPFLSESEAHRLGLERVSLERLAAESDVVSLHAPAIESTRGMITRDLLFSMRQGAIFINTARGSLVDQIALTDAIRDRRIFAILDVTDPMMLDGESELWALENVLLTPHIAGATGSDLSRLGRGAVDEAIRVLTGEGLQHAIHLHDLSRIA